MKKATDSEFPLRNTSPDLVEFLRRGSRPKSWVCRTCAIGPYVTNEIDHWLTLRITGQTTACQTSLFRFLVAHRNYKLSKDSLRRHLGKCKAAEYEKAIQGG